MTNSLLVRASSASLSSAACVTAKSPAFTVRLNWRCSNAWPDDFAKNEKDCVATNANGIANSRLYMPTALGVGYSLMPSIPATLVPQGGRYSIASVPNSRREVASAQLTGPKGSGMRCHSQLTSNPKYSSSDEHGTSPARYTPSGSGS